MEKNFRNKALVIAFIIMYIVIIIMGIMLVAMISKDNKALVKLYMFFPLISIGAFQSHYILLRDNEIDVLKKQDIPILALMTVCSIIEYFFRIKGFSKEVWLPVLIIWAILIIINAVTQGYRYNTKIWRWNIVDALRSKK